MFAYIVENALLVVTFTIVGYFLTRHLFDPKRKNLPPGPRGVPILGYIPFMPTDNGPTILRLFREYGKIFSVRMGSQDVVFLSDFNVIKKITMRDVFNYRPEFFVFSLFPVNLLVKWNGEEWKEQRKFALRILHHLGVGKQEVEEKILDEIDDLIKGIDKVSDKPVDVHRRLGSSISNVVTLLITGKRYEYEHPTRVMIDDSFLPRGNGVRPNIFSYLFYMPIISQVGKLLPLPPLKALNKRSTKVMAFMNDEIKRMRDSFDPKTGDPTCFIEAYLKEMAETTTGKYFDESHLIGNAFTFFAAGTNTMSDFLTWFLLYMMVHPVVQRKMRDEVDEVIGNKRVSTMYRDAMPYTEAVIQELHRVTSSLPSGIQHANAEDMTLEGFFLPKGTHIVLSSHAVHMDPENFTDPEEFIPERFIAKDGKFIRDERVMSFGYGKRACPGEPIANTEIFLYMTSFLQTFEIEMPKGKKYGTEGVTEFLGRIPAEMPVNVMFRRR